MRPTLGQEVLALYRATFWKSVAEGKALPLLIPYHLLGAFVVPTLWLAIPHTKRPWLYQTRWLVMAFIILFDIHVARTASSANMAFAYAAGLTAAWGVIMNMNLLIWTRPQFEAARAMRRQKLAGSPSSQARQDVFSVKETSGSTAVIEGRTHQRRQNTTELECLSKREADASDTNRGGTNDRYVYEYYWQSFPEQASFWIRLGWAADLVCSFRGSGWTNSISSIPRPSIPSSVSHNPLIDMDSIPTRTKSGYQIPLTERELVRTRLTTIVTMYLIIDVMAVLMTRDPYFILGPDNPLPPLPSYLQELSPYLLLAYRETLCLVGVITAITGVFNLSDLVQYFVGKQLWPNRAQLWQYSSTFGSFEAVLDRGLAGWWGACWHQTFRMQFVAPSAYLLRHGYLQKDGYLGMFLSTFVSFLQSSLLHICGSISSIPDTKIWRAPAFFMLQVPGVALQRALTVALGSRERQTSPFVSRTVNVAFTISWLYATSRFFMDDLSADGLWMFEPVPASLCRLLGFGQPGEGWWRWDRDYFPRWYAGKYGWYGNLAL